jgi:hypothetical protein
VSPPPPSGSLPSTSANTRPLQIAWEQQLVTKM